MPLTTSRVTAVVPNNPPSWQSDCGPCSRSVRFADQTEAWAWLGVGLIGDHPSGHHQTLVLPLLVEIGDHDDGQAIAPPPAEVARAAAAASLAPLPLLVGAEAHSLPGSLAIGIHLSAPPASVETVMTAVVDSLRAELGGTSALTIGGDTFERVMRTASQSWGAWRVG